MLARIPGCELVFVCSEHPGTGLLEYDASLVPHGGAGQCPGPGARGLRGRALGSRPVAEELPPRAPSIFSRISEIVAGRPAMIEPWNVMGAEAAVAQRLGLPYDGIRSDLWPLGFKSAGRRIFRGSGVPVPLGSEDARNLDDIAEAIHHDPLGRTPGRAAWSSSTTTAVRGRATWWWGSATRTGGPSPAASCSTCWTRPYRSGTASTSPQAEASWKTLFRILLHQPERPGRRGARRRCRGRGHARAGALR